VQEVAPKVLPRALRIVHGLAVEIERRGHHIALVGPKNDVYGRSAWRPAQDGQFVVTINGHDFKLRLFEKGAALRGGPWAWGTSYDTSATGQLNLSILHGGDRQSTWGDRKRWSLEDRLPQILRELETLAVEAEQWRVARERKREEHQRAWEQAMAQAKVHALEQHRVEILHKRVSSWEQAERIRAYCEAIVARYREEAVAADPEAERWLQFAREYSDRLQSLPRMPPDPELTPKMLEPHLGGWSPHGANRGRW
jgi:hypothetical protein